MDHFDSLNLNSRLTAQSIKYDSAYNWTIRNYQVREFDGLVETITTGSSIDTVLQIVPNDFIIAASDQQMMTSPDLRNYIKSQKERGMGNIQPFQIEYHSRIAMVFSAFILTIIGASISAKSKRWNGIKHRNWTCIEYGLYTIYDGKFNFCYKRWNESFHCCLDTKHLF